MKSINPIKQVIVLCLSLTSLISSLGRAHEGHNKTPGALAAPHGGQIKGTDQLYLELVADTEGIKLYPLDHDLKPVVLADVKVEGTFQLPRAKKSETLQWTSGENYFSSKVKVKSTHRYNVDLKVSFKNKTDKLNFTVEPQ